MKWPCKTIRALTGIVLVVATTVASMAGPCERDGGTGAEFLGLGPLAPPCTPQAPDSHSGCSCSACPASSAKAPIVSRQAGKPYRASQESSPAFVAGMLQPLSAFRERQPRHLPLSATNSGILRSTILLI